MGKGTGTRGMGALADRVVEDAKSVHFVGIGGAGMSALAAMLLGRGIVVTGSDTTASEVTRRLDSLGARVTIGHDERSLADADWVIVSDAIGPDNPERVAAEARGIPVWRRSELLGWVMKGKLGIAISGTHGKTTTTAMVAQALIAADLDPTALVGGDLREWGGNARLGHGKILVVEACEAYNSFLDLRPTMVVITNVEADHLDFHGSEERLRGNFQDFVRMLPKDGHLFLHVNDPSTPELSQATECPVTTYGIEAGDLRAELIERRSTGTTFSVTRNGQPVGNFATRLAGAHNVLNALAAIGIALEAGAPAEAIRIGLAGFEGVVRRMERIGEVDGVTVMDDYAHHPTEIRASIDALRQQFGSRRIVAIFQPHLYSRTRDFLAEFAESLAGADEVVITDIYPAREALIPGISAASIVERFHGLKTGKACAYIPDRHRIADGIVPRLRSGDVVVTIGAGSIVEQAHDLIRGLQQRANRGLRPLRVAVLMGGDSAEREVSLLSGQEVLASLSGTRFEGFGVDPAQVQDGGGLRGLDILLAENRPDVAFLALHGTHGEDGCIQGLLEMLGIPYTGSGVLSSALAMDKRLAKTILASHGIDVPTGVSVGLQDISELGEELPNGLRYPVIVKPNAQGSTLGVTRLYAPGGLCDAVRTALAFDDTALIEELVKGVEISASVLGNNELTVLPLVEIVPAGGFYDFQAKYTPGATEEICPARISAEAAETARNIARRSFEALGCRGFARVDMIVTPERICVLELNTLPGLTPTSLLPRSSAEAGITFPNLVSRIIELALETEPER